MLFLIILCTSRAYDVAWDKTKFLAIWEIYCNIHDAGIVQCDVRCPNMAASAPGPK